MGTLDSRDYMKRLDIKGLIRAVAQEAHFTNRIDIYLQTPSELHLVVKLVFCCSYHYHLILLSFEPGEVSLRLLTVPIALRTLRLPPS